MWLILILVLILEYSCVEVCEPPSAWNHAWYLRGCEEIDGVKVCYYRDQTCTYVVQGVDSCGWEQVEFYCG